MVGCKPTRFMIYAIKNNCPKYLQQYLQSNKLLIQFSFAGLHNIINIIIFKKNYKLDFEMFIINN